MVFKINFIFLVLVTALLDLSMRSELAISHIDIVAVTFSEFTISTTFTVLSSSEKLDHVMSNRHVHYKVLALEEIFQE